MTEEQLLEFEDVLVSLNSACEQWGARAVLHDFAIHYPSMFEELKAQINRKDGERRLPALLR